MIVYAVQILPQRPCQIWCQVPGTLLFAKNQVHI